MAASLLKIFMGLALVHFQKYWLLRLPTLYSWNFLDEGPLDGGEDEEEGEDLDEEEMDSDDSLP